MEMEGMLTHPSMVDQYRGWLVIQNTNGMDGFCGLIHFVHGVGEEGKMHIPSSIQSSKAASERYRSYEVTRHVIEEKVEENTLS
jgi:hypothetical protein